MIYADFFEPEKTHVRELNRLYSYNLFSLVLPVEDAATNIENGFKVNSVLFVVRQSYGFVNSIVLIILLKPFRDPLLKIIRPFKRAFLSLTKK